MQKKVDMQRKILLVRYPHETSIKENFDFISCTLNKFTNNIDDMDINDLVSYQSELINLGNNIDKISFEVHKICSSSKRSLLEYYDLTGKKILSPKTWLLLVTWLSKTNKIDYELQTLKLCELCLPESKREEVMACVEDQLDAFRDLNAFYRWLVIFVKVLGVLRIGISLWAGTLAQSFRQLWRST